MYSQNDKNPYSHYNTNWEKTMNKPSVENAINTSMGASYPPHMEHTSQQINSSAMSSPANASNEPLPSQRSRFLSENYRNSSVSSQAGSAVPHSQTPHSYVPENFYGSRPFMMSAAAVSGLNSLYDNTRSDEKTPFLGTFFDKKTLRNEFERFILMKLSGNFPFPQDPATIKNNLAAYAYGLSNATLAQARAANAGYTSQTTSQMQNANVSSSKDSTADKKNNRHNNTDSKKSQEDEIEKIESKKHTDGNKNTNNEKFFDSFSDAEKSRFTENEKKTTSDVDQKTFGRRLDENDTESYKSSGYRRQKNEREDRYRGRSNYSNRGRNNEGEGRSFQRGRGRGRGRGFGRGRGRGHNFDREIGEGQGRREMNRNYDRRDRDRNAPRGFNRAPRNDSDNYFNRRQQSHEEHSEVKRDPLPSPESADESVDEAVWGGANARKTKAAKSTLDDGSASNAEASEGGVTFGDEEDSKQCEKESGQEKKRNVENAESKVSFGDSDGSESQSNAGSDSNQGGVDFGD